MKTLAAVRTGYGSARVLDQFGLDLPQAQRWTGLPEKHLRSVIASTR